MVYQSDNPKPSIEQDGQYNGPIKKVTGRSMGKTNINSKGKTNLNAKGKTSLNSKGNTSLNSKKTMQWTNEKGPTKKTMDAIT